MHLHFQKAQFSNSFFIEEHLISLLKCGSSFDEFQRPRHANRAKPIKDLIDDQSHGEPLGTARGSITKYRVNEMDLIHSEKKTEQEQNTENIKKKFCVGTITRESREKVINNEIGRHHRQRHYHKEI